VIRAARSDSRLLMMKRPWAPTPDEDRALLNSGRSGVGGKDGVMVAVGELACVRAQGPWAHSSRCDTGLPMACFYVRRWPACQSSTAPTCP